MNTPIKFLDLAALNARFARKFEAVFQEVLASGWYLSGSATQRFEQQFAAYCGTQHCVGVANGLDALTLILMAQKECLGWDDDDEVILPAMTFVATAQAVVRARLRPVLVDVSPEDFLMDVSLLEATVTSRTRAVIPVHLYGRLCDMDAVKQVAERHHLFVLEDAAQAHGAQRNGVRAGAFGHAAAFSFYPGKNLGALGDGGSIVTNDTELADKVRALANYGSRKKYYHEGLGLNSRLDELQAAFLSVKLKSLDEDNRQRQQWARYYIEHLNTPYIQCPTWPNAIEEHVFHLFPVLTDHREALQTYLHKRGIDTLVHYPIPLHRQPCLTPYFRDKSFPITEQVAAKELSLPMSPILSKVEIDTVIQTLNRFTP